MPKTITLSGTKVKEIILSEVKGEYIIQAVYVFLMSNGKEYGAPKRAIFKDFSQAHKNKLIEIFNLFDNKTKNLEGL